MKKLLVSLGILATMFIGTQSFAACPCSNPCASPCCPAVAPCPCEHVIVPCSPACPVADCPCEPACNDCNRGCDCPKKCRWWKFWENKNCCEKCDKCDKCCD